MCKGCEQLVRRGREWRRWARECARRAKGGTGWTEQFSGRAQAQPRQAPPPRGVAQLPEELPQETKDLIPTAYKEVDGGASADGRKTWKTVMEDGGQMALPSPRGSKRSPRRLTICGRHS